MVLVAASVAVVAVVVVAVFALAAAHIVAVVAEWLVEPPLVELELVELVLLAAPMPPVAPIPPQLVVLDTQLTEPDKQPAVVHTARHMLDTAQEYTAFVVVAADQLEVVDQLAVLLVLLVVHTVAHKPPPPPAVVGQAADTGTPAADSSRRTGFFVVADKKLETPSGIITSSSWRVVVSQSTHPHC